ncbi:ABC transporter substrate-binding protein [Hydrogenophaga sp. PBL-H3]|uniref:ABC transporter substrate-binding protein n=1 Tax=Hydrogenophaga sp. PBL-H3 TaxID=434010 RepID=UPI00131F496D|nr:ABC transporter substrate-binding protein [Hydrogenophaga sp. PBL-H3]QHE77317.1 ABC transporter substrate-binding protein [Hydrogenophaga sp. PBL-H3]QHE81741.1 ABC transporter substrate-binding protein [Hydrogenophaga sp. PBL-H3]
MKIAQRPLARTVAGLVTTAFTLATLAPAAQAQSALKKLGKGEGQVDIVAWPGYIERGQTDKAFDWVTDFEKKTSCKVNVKTAGTSDEMVALMNEGGFDLVTASGDASMRLIAGKRVQPINVDLIPSYKTVDPRLQKAPWHYVNNTHYGTPYQWGWNVLMYNTTVFKDKPPTSWSVVFEETTLPDGKSNKGRVQAFDGPIYIADAALYLMKKNPALGIKDPYELNEAQYKAALDLLRGQRKLVGKYWHDAFVQIDDFTNEGVVASSSWQFMANILKSKNRPVATVVPAEGATGWADTTMMHVDAKNPNCAYMWMEHSLNTKLQGDLAAWFGSVPSVPTACKGNKLLTDQGCANQGYNSFDRISFWKTPTSKCATQNNACVPYHKWVSDYIAVLGGR